MEEDGPAVKAQFLTEHTVTQRLLFVNDNLVCGRIRLHSDSSSIVIRAIL